MDALVGATGPRRSQDGAPYSPDQRTAARRGGVRIGVIGTGFMGRTWTEVAANHVDETEVVAVAGGRRAEALARDYGAALEDSPAALLARDDIELVVVTTQPDSHRE